LHGRVKGREKEKRHFGGSTVKTRATEGKMNKEKKFERESEDSSRIAKKGERKK